MRVVGKVRGFQYLLLVEFSASVSKWSKSRFSALRLIFDRLLRVNYMLLSRFLAWTFVLALGVNCNGHQKSLDRCIAEVSFLRFAFLRICNLALAKSGTVAGNGWALHS